MAGLVERVYEMMSPDVWYTPKELAVFAHISEDDARRILRALAKTDLVDQEPAKPHYKKRKKSRKKQRELFR